MTDQPNGDEIESIEIEKDDFVSAHATNLITTEISDELYVHHRNGRVEIIVEMANKTPAYRTARFVEDLVADIDPSEILKLDGPDFEDALLAYQEDIKRNLRDEVAPPISPHVDDDRITGARIEWVEED